ncbi:MAG: hypothetical protein PHH73_02015 [Candidatus Rickettsiella isopodorum]|nr:hypothetical protein [Candidatus Rickettsiella isopodorum]
MNNDWLPIETAPKDRRIMLGYKEPFFNNIYCVPGRWYYDTLTKKSKSYWTNDIEKNVTKLWIRKNQPIAWMELPSRP